MEANTLKSVSKEIVKRLSRAPLAIPVGEDHTKAVRAAMSNAFRVPGATNDILYDTLVSLVKNGVVLEHISNDKVEAYGSGAEPKQRVRRTATYMLRK